MHIEPATISPSALHTVVLSELLFMQVLNLTDIAIEINGKG